MTLSARFSEGFFELIDAIITLLTWRRIAKLGILGALVAWFADKDPSFSLLMSIAAGVLSLRGEKGDA